MSIRRRKGATLLARGREHGYGRRQTGRERGGALGWMTGIFPLVRATLDIPRQITHDATPTTTNEGYFRVVKLKR